MALQAFIDHRGKPLLIAVVPPEKNPEDSRPNSRASTLVGQDLARRRSLLLQEAKNTDDRLVRAERIWERRQQQKQASYAPKQSAMQRSITAQVDLRKTTPVPQPSLAVAKPIPEGSIVGQVRTREVLRACEKFATQGLGPTTGKKSVYGNCTFGEIWPGESRLLGKSSVTHSVQ